MKSAKSWIPNSTNISELIEHYNIWYGGQAMKALMKKHHGYLLKTLSMHQTCSALSTTITHRNRVLLPCYENMIKNTKKGETRSNSISSSLSFLH